MDRLARCILTSIELPALLNLTACQESKETKAVIDCDSDNVVVCQIKPNLIVKAVVATNAIPNNS